MVLEAMSEMRSRRKRIYSEKRGGPKARPWEPLIEQEGVITWKPSKSVSNGKIHPMYQMLLKNQVRSTVFIKFNNMYSHMLI